MNHDRPLFGVCARKGCEAIREVSTRAEQQQVWYCSPACRPLNAFQRAGHKGGTISGAKRAAALRARVEDLSSKLEAFELGYRRGYGAAWKQMRRNREGA